MIGQRALAMFAVLLLHGLVFGAVWFARISVPTPTAPALEVALLSAPASPRPPPASLPIPARLTALLPAQTLEVSLPVIAAAVEIAPERSSSSNAAPEATPRAVLAVPETLGAELAVQCPHRTPPRYPPQARRQREQGEVRLRVELDESGRVDRVTVVKSSGSERLDEAASTAIRAWRCRPAERDGRFVRAVALQSLSFVLQQR